MAASRGPHAPYFQSQRQDRYRDGGQKLLASGLTRIATLPRPRKSHAERTAAEKEKRPFVYSRRWMAESRRGCETFEGQGRQAVVRLKMPREGTLVIPDLIRGNVEFQWASEQDHVIQRADGTCLYHLANVVDDHDFEITHVIRAEEHLSNTPRQIFIAQSLRLSAAAVCALAVRRRARKQEQAQQAQARQVSQECRLRQDQRARPGDRKGDRACRPAAETFNPVIVDFYEQVGYLPHAVLNYLLLLGWSLDETTEFFTPRRR